MHVKDININNVEDIIETFYNIFTKEPWNDNWTPEQLNMYIIELINTPNSLAFGLYENDKLIGISLGRIKHWYEGTEYSIEELGILPDYQNKGYGKFFFQQIEKKLLEKNIRFIILQTDRDVSAYNFYKKIGFVELTNNVMLAKRIDKKE